MHVPRFGPAAAAWMAVLFFLLFLQPAASIPFPAPSNATSSVISARAGSFYLRILPLGASITWGMGSSTGNGYRKDLRDQLRFDGWNVNMVGSRSGGSMKDSDVEGWSGYRVDQVTVRAQVIVPLTKPNVVLINAGTNDAAQNFYVMTAGDRMRAMINFIFSQSPGVSVVLSTLLPNANVQSNVNLINMQYRQLVRDLAAQGQKIVLCEMDDGFITTADLPDGVHPADAGYKKMASRWHQAIGRLETNGWLVAPTDAVSFSDASGATGLCEKVAGSGNSDPRGKTQVLKALSPRIIDDGPYTHSSQSMGSIHTGFYVEPDDVWFAQVVSNGADRGGELDDWVFSQGSEIYYRENLGSGSLGAKTLIPTLTGKCAPAGIRWGDVNNDGLDDFICLSTSGAMNVHINDGSKPPVFRSVGLYRSAPAGYTRANVRLGDIDGDGRLDYCIVTGAGNVRCWRNGGQRDKADYWQDFGQGTHIFPSQGMGNIAGVQLVDLNGDFRADWIWISDTGQVTTFINQRGQTKGLKPNWVSAGVTHAGMGEAGARSQIRFGRLYGTNRADYVYIKCMPPSGTPIPDRCDYQVRVWKNLGSGGKHQKGDGSRFCDMTGSGNDDYVFIDHNSKITIFRNQNTPPNTNYASWADRGVVLDLAGTPRKAIHLGDWNGDGFCDIIITGKTTGSVDVYFTYWDQASDTFTFSAKTRVMNSGCTEGWGVGLYDLGMRFHDIDGDKRVDYLCLEKNGRTTGWLNKPEAMLWQGQIKFSVQKDRANHRWADVNGDGLADFMWVDKFSGNTHVWYNMGPRQISGSSFWWHPKGRLYAGSSTGPNLHFPNLGGVGRADMTEVNPKTGLGWTWFNSCPPGGDDGPIGSPGLPPAPGTGVPPPEEDGDELTTTILTVDPAVWGEPTVRCEPPCIIVFPPKTLPTTTTIYPPPLRTSLEVGWTTTVIEAGVPITKYTTVTVTTTIEIPAIRTSIISYSNVHVPISGHPLIVTARPSILPPTMVLTAMFPGITAEPVVRTLSLPPWPPSGVLFPTAPLPPTTTTTTPAPNPGPGDDRDDDEEDDDEGIAWATPVFPSATVSWVTEWVPEPTTKTVGGQPWPVIPCWAWFIWSCPPDVGGIILIGWDKTGVYPRGGPPRLGPGPPPIGLRLPPLPWPMIKIGPDRKPSYDEEPKPEEQCETVVVDLCTITTSHGILVGRAEPTPVVTAAPRIPFGEFLGLGKRDSTTTTQTITSCTQVTGCGREDITSTTTESSSATAVPHVVFPVHPHNDAGEIRHILNNIMAINNVFESRTNTLGTIFFHASLTPEQRQYLEGTAGVDAVYRRTREDGRLPGLNVEDSLAKRDVKQELWFNDTAAADDSLLQKRAQVSHQDEDEMIRQEMVALSWPPGAGPVPKGWGSFMYDDSAGFGTFAYVIDYNCMKSHPEFDDVRSTMRSLYPGPNPVTSDIPEADGKRHGTKVLSKIVGKNFGMAKRAQTINTVFDHRQYIAEHWLDAMVKVHEDIRSHSGRGPKSVVTMSVAMLPSMAGGDAYVRKMSYLIQSIINTGAVFVTGSGNAGTDGGGMAVYGLPALLRNPAHPNAVTDMIVVGGVLADGAYTMSASDAPFVDVYAPSRDVKLPAPTFPSLYDQGSGTSFAAPTVAGLALYLRGLEPGLTTAAAVKSRIVELAYVREAPPGKNPADYFQPMIWNGQLIGGGNVCGTGGPAKRQVTGPGSSCPVNIPPPAVAATFNRGAPSPTCASSGCGQFCRGFFCEGSPVLTNPDFLDPRNPNSVQNPASPNYGQWVEPDPRDPADPGVILKEPYDPFPSIPPAPTDCFSTTSTVQCMGSGGRRACYTATGVCVTAPPPMPTPIVHGSASCPAGQQCLATNIVPTNCRNVAARTYIPEPPTTLTASSPGPMMTPASGPSTPSSVAHHQVDTREEQREGGRSVATMNNTTSVEVVDRLHGRQTRQICDKLISCGHCATPRYVPCVHAQVEALLGFGGNDLVARVFVDGNLKCMAFGKIRCDWPEDEDGSPCWNVYESVDCGGGTQLLWQDDFMYLHHDGTRFPLPFGPAVSKREVWCPITVGRLCAIHVYTARSGFC